MGIQDRDYYRDELRRRSGSSVWQRRPAWLRGVRRPRLRLRSWNWLQWLLLAVVLVIGLSVIKHLLS